MIAALDPILAFIADFHDLETAVVFAQEREGSADIIVGAARLPCPLCDMSVAGLAFRFAEHVAPP
jgi:hypothetical protein